MTSITVSLPEMAWYGDTIRDFDFPASWDVTVCNMKGYDAPPLDDAGFRKALANPIGTPTIKELAKGKKEVVILFDDMSRGTPTATILPYVLEELAKAGIEDDHIRLVSAIGAHGSMNGIDFRKKLGNDVMRRFKVYNHNPYENCTPLGMSSRGIPMAVNSEVMRCDLKIGIGSIVPHPLAGFGGGSKIILPGVSSIIAIDLNHTRLGLSPTIGIGQYEGNLVKEDMDEAARMAGLDIKIDVLMNLKREATALFIGDVVAEHVEGVKAAKEHCATPLVKNCDIVVSNCFAKANEMGLGTAVAAPLLKPGGDMVLVAETPEGQINHYWCRSFGDNIGGRGWVRRTSLPPNTGRLTVLTPYPDRVGADWIAPYDRINWAESWPPVLDMLKATYGEKARVAVIPDATVQYFPETMEMAQGAATAARH